MDQPLAERIGVEARRARGALGLTQQDAAERIGVSVEFYARIERGGTLPSVPTLQKLASSLGTSADALLGIAVGEQKARPASLPAVDLSDEWTPLGRRVVRRLAASDQLTLNLVNQMLIQLEGMKRDWLRVAVNGRDKKDRRK
jgi:transcriptional regulator with XRE-family HTH domain